MAAVGVSVCLFLVTMEMKTLYTCTYSARGVIKESGLENIKFTMVRVFIHVSASYTQTLGLNISDSTPMPREISTPQFVVQNSVCSYEYYEY